MVNFKEDERLNKLNHSCAHLMAQAVKHLFPEAKFWVGPVVETGFYYDIDLGDKVINDEDIEKISKEMKKLAKDGKRIVRHEITKAEALEMFKDDPYKLDLINRMDESEQVISCYTQGDFTDLCRGPHVESTKELKHFKLLKVSGAYYKGDSKNKMLQRIYGICFDTEEELQKHLEFLEDCKQRDHRKLGKDLGIFMFSELVGKGLPMWLPNGFTVRQNLVNYIMNKEISLGYKHVMTPSLGNVDLYKTSGHWDHYKEDMFPAMELDDEAYVLRPMNCPHHMMMFKNSLHSYRDLPVRIAEIANDFRYEASGAVCGIERTRAFTQNDSHIFCRLDQIKDEFQGVVKLILDVYKDFGFNDYEFRLSLRDKNNKAKYIDNDEMWETAESQLRAILKEMNIDFYEAEGEAAFYGPKIDIQIKTALNHDVTIPTCQLDFALPERFDLTYVGEDNKEHRPVVIHRAILGSSDRFISFLIEETKGAFPLWLSPIQVKILPITDAQIDYCTELKAKLRAKRIRVELDDSNEKIGYKIRKAQLEKVPYMLVIGANEQESQVVTVRARKNGANLGEMTIDEFIEKVQNEVENKAIDR